MSIQRRTRNLSSFVVSCVDSDETAWHIVIMRKLELIMPANRPILKYRKSIVVAASAKGCYTCVIEDT